ncbi:MAG: arylsulfotransferase family protein [Candidatus Brocadiaceae bacterium]|jgi:hypothetical protein
MPETGTTVCEREECWDGYTLCQSRYEQSARLIDLGGREVHRWSYGYRAEELAGAFLSGWHYAEMLPDGNLLAILKEVEDGFGGAILELDWDGNLTWSVDLPAHHDFERLADGSTLVVCREYVENPTIRPGRTKSDSIVQLQPDGEVTWEWHSDRHARQMADLVEIDFPVEEYDWAHTNTVESLPPNAAADQDGRFRPGNVLFSCRNIDTVGVIERGSGDVIWAWGPGVLEKQHMPTMLENGHLLIFDNGCYRGSSAVVEMDPLGGEIVWRYEADPPESFYTHTRGANQRLPNGNTLITDSDTGGRVFEVTPDGEIVWEYLNEELDDEGERQPIYRAMRYPPQMVQRLMAGRG